MKLTEATAYDVFEINACHGNKFESSCQTACQFQYILLVFLLFFFVLQYLKCSFCVLDASCWRCLTAKDFQGVLLVMCCTVEVFFFTSPFWLCFLSFQSHISGVFSNVSIIKPAGKRTVCLVRRSVLCV